MAMKFLSATQDAKGIHYSIWLDTTKFQVIVDEDGQPVETQDPDPAYVRKYDWASMPDHWAGDASSYEDMTLTEVKLLAAEELEKLEGSKTPQAELSAHGQTF